MRTSYKEKMKNLYVSTIGSDSNPGTIEKPLKTMAATQNKVRELIKSGNDEDIIVHLGEGTHRLSRPIRFGPEDGGNGNFTVTYQGDENGKTTISSGYLLDGWQKCEETMFDVPEKLRDNIWFIDLPAGTKVNSLYGKNGSISRARGESIKPLRTAMTEKEKKIYGPDGPYKGESKRSEDGKTFSHDRFGFSKGVITPASDLDEAEFLIIPANQWTMNILSNKLVDFDNQIVYLDQPCTYPIGIPHCAPEGSIWLENSLSVIKPGSWVYHSKTSRLYYCPKGDRPESNLEAACLSEFILAEGIYNIDGEKKPVQGIHFHHISFTTSNRFTFHGLTGKGIQHDWEMHDAPSCMLRFRHALNCSVTNCHFHDGSSGGVRMDLACQYNKVENCEFNNLGGCGVVLCGYGLSRQYLNKSNSVINNHIHHIGQAYWHSPAIFIWQSGDNQIANNHLHDTPYTAIVCSGRTVYDREGKGECSGTIHWDDVEEQCGKDYVHNVWHYSGLPSWWMREPLMHSRENLIEYNHIYDVMQIMGDGNGIYVSGAGGGNIVRYNVVGPCPSPTMAEGIRCDDDQHHTIVHGNLIFGQHGHATGITLKGVNRVTNNILALPLKGTTRGMLSLETGPLNGAVIHHNIILTSALDQKFVSEIRIHGTGRKARLCDTDSDHNIYYCTADSEIGTKWVEHLQSLGVDRHSLSCDPGFVDAKNGSFNLKDDAAALKTGFQPLPLDKMFT